MFSIAPNTAANIFYATVTQLFQHRSNLPVLVDAQGNVNDAERDKMLESAFTNTPLYYKELVKV